MKGKITLSVLAAVFLSARVLFCSGSLSVPWITESPCLDGNAGDSAWKDIGWNAGFHSYTNPALPAKVQTRFKAAHDKRFLYLLLQ